MRAHFALLVLLLAVPAFAQESGEITVDVNVVNIPVTVTDQEGRAIVDLKKEDFHIYEDGQPVEIKYFTGSQDEAKKPRIRVGFLIDLSNTARLYYKNYKDSIGDLAFLMMPEGGDNEGFLMGYHTEVDTLVDYTRDPYPIMERMEKLKHGGGSSMLGAVYEACNEKLLSSPYQGIQEPRKFIVIVGDGHDNASKVSLQEAIYACQQQQVTIYAVSTEAWGFQQKEEGSLRELARETGGIVVQPMQKVHTDVSGYLSKPQDAGNYQYEVGTGLYARAALEALYKAILAVSGQVQSQYIIGYTPSRPFTDSSYRKIEVKVNMSSSLVNVYARTGYFPPILEAPKK
ncbi:MAG: VWA domain-containing protein [Bryobacterales bacterium]